MARRARSQVLKCHKIFNKSFNFSSGLLDVPKCIEFNLETASSAISAKALKMLYFHFSYKAILLALENYNKASPLPSRPIPCIVSSCSTKLQNYDDFLIKQREHRQTATKQQKIVAK